MFPTPSRARAILPIGKAEEFFITEKPTIFDLYQLLEAIFR